MLAVKLIKQRYAKAAHYVIVASANGNMTDILLDNAYSLSTNPNKRELDMLITTGELYKRGFACHSVKRRRAACNFLNREPRSGQPRRNTRARTLWRLKATGLPKKLNKAYPYVTTWGIGEHKEITTLKRGGSGLFRRVYCG